MNLTMIVHNGDGSIASESLVSSVTEAHQRAQDAGLTVSQWVRVVRTEDLDRARARNPVWPRNLLPPGASGEVIGRVRDGQYIVDMDAVTTAMSWT